MNWIEKSLLAFIAHLYLLRNITPISGSSLSNEKPFEDEKNSSSQNGRLENYIDILSSILMKPWPFGLSPLVYMENEIDQVLKNEDSQIYKEYDELSENNNKRSKYYRKFPLKRQNKYSRYDAENRYLCLPSKDEVYKLLVALHQTRQGKRAPTVSICNRKRPARTVFTNIRFLGK